MRKMAWKAFVRYETQRCANARLLHPIGGKSPAGTASRIRTKTKQGYYTPAEAARLLDALKSLQCQYDTEKAFEDHLDSADWHSLGEGRHMRRVHLFE